jgi:hypothetical protein
MPVRGRPQPGVDLADRDSLLDVMEDRGWSSWRIGVGRLLTRDRDFSRFPWIEIVDLDEEPSRLA